MKARSLADRLAVLQQGLTLAVILAFAGSSLGLTAHVLRQQQHKLIDDTAVRTALGYEAELAEELLPKVAAEITVREQATPGVHIEIFDRSGQLLARSDRNASNDASGVLKSTARTAGGVVIHTSMSNELEHASIAALVGSLMISAVPLLLASLLLGRWIARRALRPLSAMADRAATSSIEKGMRSLGQPSGLAEIDRLGHAFNRLLERLDDALRAERQLSADASHELRTPLTVLSGELEMASAQVRDDPALRKSLSTASDQVRAMRELVEAILMLHRSGEEPRTSPRDFEPVNLSDLVRDLAAESRGRYPGRDSDLAFQAPDEVLVLGTPSLLTSAVRNLIDNALKFTHQGQPVRITVNAAPATSTVTVEDGGPGVPDHERERVFDPFFRGAEARAGGVGFGLGLPILRRVARAHGGDVTVGSSSLGGARFVLALPTMGRGA